ncbi:hypothetical protein BBJ28_00012279 [Nothophytophthora sp. Chile5]|nr:hypothetical protein BBJ28_00012279 [Nothophytophthora sp. Chile5]
MDVSSALNSLYFRSDAPSFRVFQAVQQQQQHRHAGEIRPYRNVSILPALSTTADPPASVSSSSSAPDNAVASPVSKQAAGDDGYSTPPLREYPEEYAKYQIHQMELDKTPTPSPVGETSKRKRLDISADSEQSGPTPAKRKASSDFLRKGQWTTTEERLARRLIEAFEEGYLPIYTGIRLRGYLAVQLQCDPMRVSKKLCAGAVDGKQIPKNYGQKKFKLRKKAMWDREEAGRLLAELERLAWGMWTAAGLQQPEFLTLSTTRNPDEDCVLPSGSCEAVASPVTPVKTWSPPEPKTKKHKSVVFPIIYLNLSKKPKRRSAANDSKTGAEGANNGRRTTSTSKRHEVGDEPVAVDSESLQAAYDLLTLCRPDLSPCTSPIGANVSSLSA